MAADALQKGDVSTAAQLYGQILQEDPGNPKAVAGLARCYLQSGDIDRAKKTLQLVRPDGASDEAIRAVEAELALKDERRGGRRSRSLAGEGRGRSCRSAGALRSRARARCERGARGRRSTSFWKSCAGTANGTRTPRASNW